MAKEELESKKTPVNPVDAIKGEVKKARNAPRKLGRLRYQTAHRASITPVPAYFVSSSVTAAYIRVCTPSNSTTVRIGYVFPFGSVYSSSPVPPSYSSAHALTSIHTLYLPVSPVFPRYTPRFPSTY